MNDLRALMQEAERRKSIVDDVLSRVVEEENAKRYARLEDELARLLRAGYAFDEIQIYERNGESWAGPKYVFVQQVIDCIQEFDRAGPGIADRDKIIAAVKEMP